MLASGTDPLRVKSIEIGNVKRVQDALAFGSEGQLFLVGPLSQTGIHNRDRCHTTKTKCRDKTTMHRIFVEVELDPIHGCGSATVLLFQNLSLAVLGCQVGVDFLLVVVVVGKRCIAPATSDLRTSVRFLLESDQCCATERFCAQRPPSRQSTAARRECRGGERSDYLSRSRLP